MTGDEIREVDLGLLNQDPFIESINIRRRLDQKPLYRDTDSLNGKGSRSRPPSIRRRSSLLLDKVLRRGSYQFNHGEENLAFSMKKGTSVSSSIYSSSSFVSEPSSPKSRSDSKTTWFMGATEIDSSSFAASSFATSSSSAASSFATSSSSAASSDSEIVASELADVITPQIESSDGVEMDDIEPIYLTEEEIKGYFSFFNISNDGFITKRQLRRSMELLGIQLSSEDLDLMIQTADHDSDGLISLEDFKSLPFIAPATF